MQKKIAQVRNSPPLISGCSSDEARNARELEDGACDACHCSPWTPYFCLR